MQASPPRRPGPATTRTPPPVKQRQHPCAPPHCTGQHQVTCTLLLLPLRPQPPPSPALRIPQALQWLRHGCLPVIVVEGRAPEEKREAQQQR